MQRITADQLNAAARLLGTNDRQVVIAAIMRTLVAEGVDVAVAFDALFGAGAFKKFAGEVYHALRAKAAA